MTRSEHVLIPRCNGSWSRIILPGRNPRCTYSLAQLREYTYTHWAGGDGRYYISTGWGQGMGWAETEAEALAYCGFVKENMRYKAVLTAENLPFAFGTECDILDLDRHWDADCRLAYHGCQFWAGRGQWRFKIVWNEYLTS